MKRSLFHVAACLVALIGAKAQAATLDITVPSPISRAIIELGTSEVFPTGLGGWGLDNLISVSGDGLEFITFEERPPQSFGTGSMGGPPPGGPQFLTVGNTTFRANRLNPSLSFTFPVFGFDPGGASDTIFTDGALLLADANTRLGVDFASPVTQLQFGLSFGSQGREGRVGTVELFAIDRSISLGRFDIFADLEPGDGLTSARVTAEVPLPASAFLLLSALGFGAVMRRRSRLA